MNDSFSDEFLSAYLDGELTPEERVEAERALAENAELRRLFEELQTLRSRLQSLPIRTPTDQLTNRIMQQAEQIHSQRPNSQRPNSRPLSEADVSPVKPDAPTTGSGRDEGKRFGWRRLALVGGALAASLLVVVGLTRTGVRDPARNVSMTPSAATDGDTLFVTTEVEELDAFAPIEQPSDEGDSVAFHRGSDSPRFYKEGVSVGKGAATAGKGGFGGAGFGRDMKLKQSDMREGRLGQTRARGQQELGDMSNQAVQRQQVEAADRPSQLASSFSQAKKMNGPDDGFGGRGQGPFGGGGGGGGGGGTDSLATSSLERVQWADAMFSQIDKTDVYVVPLHVTPEALQPATVNRVFLSNTIDVAQFDVAQAVNGPQPDAIALRQDGLAQRAEVALGLPQRRVTNSADKSADDAPLPSAPLPSVPPHSSPIPSAGEPASRPSDAGTTKTDFDRLFEAQRLKSRTGRVAESYQTQVPRESSAAGASANAAGGYSVYYVEASPEQVQGLLRGFAQQSTSTWYGQQAEPLARYGYRDTMRRYLNRKDPAPFGIGLGGIPGVPDTANRNPINEKATTTTLPRPQPGTSANAPALQPRAASPTKASPTKATQAGASPAGASLADRAQTDGEGIDKRFGAARKTLQRGRALQLDANVVSGFSRTADRGRFEVEALGRAKPEKPPQNYRILLILKAEPEVVRGEATRPAPPIPGQAAQGQPGQGTVSGPPIPAKRANEEKDAGRQNSSPRQRAPRD